MKNKKIVSLVLAVMLVLQVMIAIVPVGADVTPTSSMADKKAAIIDYLESVTAQGKTLSAQHTAKADFSAVNQMKTLTGESPAIISIDLMSCTFDKDGANRVVSDNNNGTATTNEVSYNVGSVDAAIDYVAENGGLVTASWHWFSPIGGENKSFWASADNRGNTSFDIGKAFVDGVAQTETDEYKAIIEDLDLAATELQKLEDAGIVVLWRPLHEAQGTFWWYGNGNYTAYKALWNTMYEYFTETKGLDNLIWVWSSTDGLDNISNWCPANVDIVGADIYNSNIDEMNSAFAGINKPVALTEFGSFANAQYLVDNGKESAWCLFWNEINYDNDSNKIAAKAFYADEKVVNLDDLPYEIRTVCLAQAPAEGTAMNPKKISNQADLEALATAVNGGADQAGVFYELTNDITLTGTWTSIGKYTSVAAGGFAGTFDGKGYTISGLTLDGNSSTSSYIGLFSYVSKAGMVKNLNVHGTSDIGTSPKSSAGIVGALAGIIDNCTFRGTVVDSQTGNNNRAIGGIVAMTVCLDGTPYATVKNCSTTADTTIQSRGVSRVGGIVGWNNGGFVKYCTNNATVKSADTDTSQVIGGIVGYNFFNFYETSVENCVNAGAISVYSSFNYKNVGGIVGNLSSGTIINCYNVGSMSGYNVSGIVGYNNGILTTAAEGAYNEADFVINCYNAATMTGTRIGGICKSNAATFTNCYYLDSIENAWFQDGNNKGTLEGATAVSADYMKTTEFVAALNAGSDVWTANSAENNGYPVFNATSKYVLDVLGSTIRYETPTGIRFASTVKKTDALAELIGRGEYAYSAEDSVYFGTLVITKAALGDAELTVNTAKASNAKAEKLYAQDAESITFTVALYDIPASFYSAEIVVRPYIAVKNAQSGEWTYIYGAEFTSSYEDTAQAIYDAYTAEKITLDASQLNAVKNVLGIQ